MTKKEMWTLEAFENAGTKELEIEGRYIVIKAVDPKVLVTLFGDSKPDEEMTTEDLLKNLDMLEEVLVNGLVTPEVTKETVSKLGRFKQKIANEIIKFSGVGEEASEDVENFRE